MVFAPKKGRGKKESLGDRIVESLRGVLPLELTVIVVRHGQKFSKSGDQMTVRNGSVDFAQVWDAVGHTAGSAGKTERSGCLHGGAGYLRMQTET